MSGDLFPWVLLFAIVGSMLALDLLVLNREAKPVPFARAAAWSLLWVTLALGFGGWVALTRGSVSGAEYLAGYLLELSLSVDNVFVFALIFAAFAVPGAYQHRLLFWGILGAVVFRAVFIALGTAILDAAHWVIYLLGILLIVTGFRLAGSRGHDVDPSKNPVLRLVRRVVPMTDGYRGPAFFVREHGRRVATPLLAVLVAIETTDIMFALDSIPAVFAVTTDPFIVFSSNLFAILGLRALYFLLAGLLDRFVYLRLGLAALLVFAGVKILVGSVYDVPVAASLLVIVAILATAIGTSLVATHPRRNELLAPAVRLVAGPVLAVLAVAVFALFAAVRDGQAWPVAVAVVALVTAVGGTAIAAGVALRRGIAAEVSAGVLRVATGALLGTTALTLFAAAALMRETHTEWIALDLLVVALLAVTVAAGYRVLQRLRAQLAWVRAWATAGALLVLGAAILVMLD